MTAPVVMTLDWPGDHSEVSEPGRSVQRHENVPNWSLPSCVGEVSGAAGVNDSGR